MSEKLLVNFGLTLLAVAFTSPAIASDKISSPTVKEGKFAMEDRYGYDFDDEDKKDGRQLHKLVFDYGITDTLRPQIKFNIDNQPHESVELTAIETGLRWQFFKPEEAWAAAALEGNFKWATEHDTPDEFDLKLLVAKTICNFNNVLNLSIKEEFGENSRAGRSLKAGFKTTYALETYFEPGFEIYADTGRLRDELSYDEQKHQMGPVALGKITDNVKYEVGYLIGTSESATDGRFKFILNYNQQF